MFGMVLKLNVLLLPLFETICLILTINYHDIAFQLHTFVLIVMYVSRRLQKSNKNQNLILKPMSLN